MAFPRLYLSLLIFFPISGWSQDDYQGDSTRIAAQFQLAENLFLAKPDSAAAIATRGLIQANALNNPYLNALGYYLISKANWVKANYLLSTDYGFKALRESENSPYVDLWIKSLLGLGRTFIDLKDYTHADQYLRRAIDLSKQLQNKALLGGAYREYSMLLMQKRELDSAMQYADLGLAIFEPQHDSLNASILYSRKAKIYFLRDQFDKSRYYNNKALMIDSIVGNRRGLAVNLTQCAADALHSRQYDTAIVLLNKSIQVHHELNNLSGLVQAHALLAEVYHQQNLFALSNLELKKASEIKDSLYNSERTAQINQMQSLYELSDKERTIELLAKENDHKTQEVKIQRYLLVSTASAMLLLGVVIFFLIRLRHLQQKANQDLADKNYAIALQKEEISAQAENLQQLNNLKTRIFTVISHDLRGPIVNLHSLLSLLSSKSISKDEFSMISDKLKANVDITRRTLENLLNWSMSQMEGLKTEISDVHVKRTVQETSNLLFEIAAQKSITLEHEVADDLVVRADLNHLQVILRNLIHNAIKFSRPKQSVRISASVVGDDCLIMIRDSGIGMSAEEINLVHNPTKHFSKHGTLQEKGTGLGLLLCKDFIERNSGRLTITSEPGKGTTVAFTLPLATVLVQVVDS